MKTQIICAIAYLMFCSALGFAQSNANPALTAKIDRLYMVDQSVQGEIVSAFQNGASQEAIEELVRKEKRQFADNIPVLKEIIRKHGFPTYSMVGTEASKKFFVMVQHSDADVDFQKACLKKARKFIETKQVSTENYAYLTDRINTNSGKPQIYGTQLDYDASGKAFAKKVKDPASLNTRRASVGLGTIEEYLKKATELHKKQNTKN